MKRGTQITPNPIPFPKIRRKEDVEKIRRLDCREYDDCLGEAKALDWPGFTCVRCHAFTPRTPEEQAYDKDQLLECLWTLGGVGARYFDDEFWAQLSEAARDLLDDDEPFEEPTSDDEKEAA